LEGNGATHIKENLYTTTLIYFCVFVDCFVYFSILAFMYVHTIFTAQEVCHFHVKYIHNIATITIGSTNCWYIIFRYN